MEFINNNNLIIRNFIASDLIILSKYIKEESLSKSLLTETNDCYFKSLNDDFDSDGEKNLAISLKDNLIGHLRVRLDKPHIFITVNLFSLYDKRVTDQLIWINLIKYLHSLYAHRDIITVVQKFDLKRRSILENLGFKVTSIDKSIGTYTYSIFSPNPAKEK